ncbi:hypothetical protein FO675_10795 [Riemerella anatipestifer]|uniref:S41 family peptidase n=1 Tax=Riemerella anatipestifer TaxID=34085 RepID=UPI001AD633B0|nr:S41 family peptidase [Riemerella anatipestifer]MBO4234770.1 hypothetical protein [Riemerella anatipestifer]
MRKIITLITLSISIFSFAQKKCDCKKVIEFVTHQIENNSASFAHQVLEYNRQDIYKKHKNKIVKISKDLTTQKECLGLIQHYLFFLRDAHQKLYITNEYYPFKSFDDTLSVKKFITENVENHQLKRINPKGILGDWYYKNGLYSIQIQKNQQKGREYIGILKDDFRHNKQFLGFKGDIRFEFYNNHQNELTAIYWDFANRPAAYKVQFSKDTLKFGRNITFYRKKKDITVTNSFKVADSTYFKELDNNTNYLRIHTFDYENKKNIDSIISVHQNQLSTKNNLIIDVRNNGGGSDWSYYPLLPYIMDKNEYQNPIAASSIWISKDNFQNYYNERYLYNVKTNQDSLNADLEIEALKKHIGKFEPYTKSTSKVETISSYPKKVYIIQNRWDASSTEGFILTAKQSGKVKTFGENTGGFVSYGEWRKLEIPNFPAWISMTQKKMIFYDDSDFEMIGIKPDVELNPDNEKDWLEIVKKEIEK